MGCNQYGQINVPWNLPPVVAVSAGLQYSLVVTNAAKVVGWGTNTHGQRTIPAGIRDIRGIAAGYANSVIGLNSGTVVTLGAKAFGALMTRTPVRASSASVLR